MKFVTICSDFAAASQVWMRRLADNLVDLSPTIIELSPHAEPQRFHSRTIPTAPARPSRLRRIGTKFFGRSDAWQNHRQEWLLKQIRRETPDAVLCHFLTNAARFSWVWRELDIPVAVFCHGYDVSWTLCDHSGIPVHPPDYLDSVRAIPPNVRFLANSTATRHKLLSIGIDSNRVELFRFGIDVAHVPDWQHIMSQSELLFLGRLVEFKGPLETIDATAKFISGSSCSRLVIGGNGPLMDQAKRLAAKYDLDSKIEFLGQVGLEKACELRKRAAVFTAHNTLGSTTNQEEAFGVSILEAMACGLPVVTGRSGGIPDYIESGRNGFLFEPGRIDIHADMLADLFSSKELRQRIGAQAYSTVRDSFRPADERQSIVRAIEKWR